MQLTVTMKFTWLPILLASSILALPFEIRQDSTTDATAIEYGLGANRRTALDLEGGTGIHRLAKRPWETSGIKNGEGQDGRWETNRKRSLVKRPSQMSRVGDADDTIGQGGANRRAALDLVGGTELRVSGVSGHIGDGQKRAEEEESGELQDPYGTGRRNAKRVGEGSGAQDPYGNGLLNSPISHVGKRSDGQTFKRRNAGDSGGFEGTVERRGNNCVDLGFGPRC